MATPQQAEPKRKVLVAPSMNGNNMRSLILAGIAAIISVGAHALIIFLILNLDLGPANATSNDVKSESIIDDGQKEVKTEDKKEEKKETDRGKEDDIDLSRTDMGNNSL